MISYLVGASTTGPSTVATNWSTIMSTGVGNWDSTGESNHQMIVPHAMTIDRLRVNIGTVPGGVTTRTFTLVQNGTTTALTCVMGSAATSNQDLTHSVFLAAGDRISIQSDVSGIPAAAGATYWSMRQQATSLFGVLGGIRTGSASVTNYLAAQGTITNSSTSLIADIVIPTGGTFNNLQIKCVTAPGSNWVYTIFKNGVATTLTATMTNALTTVADTTHSFTVVAGDTVCVQLVSGTGAPGNISYAMSFAPTNDGESFIGYQDNGHTISNSATNFEQPMGDGIAGWNATESNAYFRHPATTVKALFVASSVSPGVSPAAYAMTLRDEIANTAATVTLTNASTTVGSGRLASVTGLSVAIADDDRIDIQSVPANTPLGVFMKSSLLLFTATAAATLLSDKFMFFFE